MSNDFTLDGDDVVEAPGGQPNDSVGDEGGSTLVGGAKRNQVDENSVPATDGDEGSARLPAAKPPAR